jgi:hypothetical protein
MADDAAEAGLVDIHTHVQPSASAGRTFLGRLFLDDHPLVGTVDELLAVMDEAAISRTVIVPWLPAHDLVDEAVAAGTDRDQAVDDVVSSWRELNRWATEAVQAHPGRLRCLVGLDPILMSEEVMAEEVDERLAAGAGGLKVAPMFLGTRPWRSSGDWLGSTTCTCSVSAAPSRTRTTAHGVTRTASTRCFARTRMSTSSWPISGRAPRIAWPG